MTADMRKLPAQAERVETGPTQFGDDWPGVFIRGDHAFAYVLALDALSAAPADPLAIVQVQGLRDILCQSDLTGMNARSPEGHGEPQGRSLAQSNLAHIGPPDWLRLARECGATVYQHPALPNQPAVVFGNESWARFTQALTAGHHALAEAAGEKHNSAAPPQQQPAREGCDWKAIALHYEAALRHLADTGFASKDWQYAREALSGSAVAAAARPQREAASSADDRPVAWRYPIGGGRFAATTSEDDARRASTDGSVDELCLRSALLCGVGVHHA